MTVSERTILGHPRGLFVLFFAEMWERFSYYGMRALLIFYLTQHWLFSDGKASLIYGAYTSLVYITPVIGGYVADRWLGQRKAVQFGALFLTFGHFLMAFEGKGGAGDPAFHLFWLALSFIIVGSGFLKANISVLVGQLYPRTDTRRDAAYTIFYMGVNLGATLGVIIAGYLGQSWGWSWGFGAAGVGMLLGLIVFVRGRPLLMGHGEAPDPALLTRKVAGVSIEWLIYIVSAAAVLVDWVLVQQQQVIGTMMLISGVILFGYILWVAAVKLDRDSRDRIFAIVFLLMLQPLFGGRFERAGAPLNLFTDRYVDREMLGFMVPASLFQSINSIYIVLLGPLFAGLWVLLSRRGLEPSTPAKFGIALVQLGAGFLVLVWGAHAGGIDAPTPVLFIFLIYLLHTTGELCLSPVGLSAMNRLAPAPIASPLMGAGFFATAGGSFVAGKISEAVGAENASGAEAAKLLVLDVYDLIGWVAIGVGVVVLVVAPLVKRLMHLDTLTDGETNES